MKSVNGCIRMVAGLLTGESIGAVLCYIRRNSNCSGFLVISNFIDLQLKSGKKLFNIYERLTIFSQSHL